MNEEKLMTVLLGPQLSEKSHNVNAASNQVVFRVRRDANKAEIRRAVEMMFDVKVVGVQVLNNRGKVKRSRMSFGKRADWKKAYVRLAPGDTIDFLGAE